MIEYFLAVDGGGTGTRVIIARPDGGELARAEAGPSALAQGIGGAWEQIQRALAVGFQRAGVVHPPWQNCALAAGLSGVHNQSLRSAFLAQLPPLAKVVLATDGYTTLLGAHSGKAGLIVAAGTGSVGEMLRSDGSHTVVGGWGFPVGDEGSGAWLGLKAVRIAQAAMDGRGPEGELARHVLRHCGSTRQDMANWVAQSAQFAYAQLAPLVFEHEHVDAAAADLLRQATRALESMAYALEAQRNLPVVVCGSIGEILKDRMALDLRQRFVVAAMGPAEGALLMLKKSLEDAHVTREST
jgi:glucosamine kinase